MRRLLRVVCALVGHDWATPILTRGSEYVEARLYHTHCQRCGLTLDGDWDWLEANRAWEHYR